ncbi:uncharacterized protein LOC143892512 isoform X5 [Tasmannia lanceolata]|uniref:uncharacterized protein LOC143892512 isoform X5 n=1 Tax=Tasmannia lanceolata TaxID=3420 RepID=UPI00406305D8
MVKGLKLCFRTWKAFSAIQSKGEFWPQRGSYGAVRFVGTLLQTKMERMRSGKDHSDMSVRCKQQPLALFFAHGFCIRLIP